jgi:hypothetical protein
MCAMKRPFALSGRLSRTLPFLTDHGRVLQSKGGKIKFTVCGPHERTCAKVDIGMGHLWQSGRELHDFRRVLIVATESAG